FTSDKTGGNPAGVWVGARLPSDSVMQEIAAEVGFSETAFVSPRTGFMRTVRYFSPKAEVSFCGHATIATGVLLGHAEGDGTYLLSTAIGEVPVVVTTKDDGQKVASLTSVEPKQAPATETLLDNVLASLGWDRSELDTNIPPVRAYAGAWHLVLAAASFDRLERLDYDFDALREIMLFNDLTTLQLIWREASDLFHARNPFPVGGVVEDPATGASAAALGGYLRASKLIAVPSTFTIRQGETMGRPSKISVHVPVTGGIVVSGTAVWL
ncbi:MAG: PhzF family phenazine biosynthesis protein, partial [Bdellovibrionales bacterium]|nr:PhzF family phenazine biosynthesis protein [Bdellovibrionales bacterium]